MNLRENLKKLREERGISQQKLADDVFVTVQMIWGIENGVKQPSLNLALALANYFDVSMDALVGR